MKLHDAYFFDNDRTIIRTIYHDDENREIIRDIPAQESNSQYRKFISEMEEISGDTGPVDKLHERTMNYLRETQENFHEQVIQIAKERGLVHDIDNINTDIYKAVAAALFGNFDPDNDKEKLFMYKLTLFEMDSIKNCKNRELKSELRKAQNLIDVTEIAIKIVKDTSDTSE